MAKHLSRGVIFEESGAMEWPRSTIMYTFDKLMQIIVTFGFFTLDDDMMSCVVQSDISEGNIVFFAGKNILNIVFACQHFPLLFTGLHNHICKLHNRNYNHRKISSHT